MSTADYSACANDLRIGRRLGIIAPCRVFPPLAGNPVEKAPIGWSQITLFLRFFVVHISGFQFDYDFATVAFVR